jgi:hypothetical protein
MLSSISSMYCILPMVSNYNMVNMPNIYNLLIALLLLDEPHNIDTIQLIRLHMGITFYDGFKQYVLKKYPLTHNLVRLVSQL